MLVPYLFFDGNTEEVMNFYADVFNGEVIRLERYSNAPGMEIPQGYENKVLHGQVKFDDSLIYFSDGPGKKEAGNQMTLTVEFDSEDKIDRAFDKLSMDGTIVLPLDKMFWGAKYGKLIDKYGIHWDLNHQLKSE